MSRPIRITCDRLLLSAPKGSDFKAWSGLRAANREHLQPYEPLWGDHANTRAEWKLRMKAWRANWSKDRGYAFFLFRRDDERLLGGVALTNIRRGAAQTATLGYWLGAEMTGQGYMTEAVDALCKWAKADLQLARIEASTLPENDASRRVLERCGFQKEGFAKAYLEIAGKRRDHVLYGLNLNDSK